MGKFWVIKEKRWDEVEKTPYGEHRLSVIKQFTTNGKDIIEYTFKNGIMWYSAMYPANSDYARKRMAD